MNVLYKAYCRIFQKAFHIAIPFLPYRTPKMLNHITDIPELLQKKKKMHPLIVTDAGIVKLGLVKPLIDSLIQSGISYSIYDQTAANPTTTHVNDALNLYIEDHCDCLISFGGGSSMDCAKAVGAKIARPNKSLDQMKGILKVNLPLPLSIAIPTTAGTGSETTLASVITDADSRHKYAINDFPLIPHYAVLDPVVTKSLPPFLTATTGMDALTHAIEAYIGNSTTKNTRKKALMAVKLIYANIDEAYNHGNHLKARKNMLRASFFAGCAFTQSYVGYVHAVAHTLGGAYNVPHGLANAILLPFVLESYGETIYSKLRDLAVAAGLCEVYTPSPIAAKLFINSIHDMKKRFNIGNTVPELKKDDIPKLAVLAAHEGNPLYPVPVLMDAHELERFYEIILED